MKTTILFILSAFLSVHTFAEKKITAKQAYTWVKSQAFSKTSQAKLLKYGAKYGSTGVVNFVQLQGITPEEKKCIVSFSYGQTEGSKLPYVSYSIQKMGSEGRVNIVAKTKSLDSYMIASTEEDQKPSFGNWAMSQKIAGEEHGMIVKEFPQVEAIVFILQAGKDSQSLYHCSVDQK